MTRQHATWLGVGSAVVVAVMWSTSVGVGLAVTMWVAIGSMGWTIRAQPRLLGPLVAVATLTPWLLIRANSWLAITVVVTTLLSLLLVGIAASTVQSFGDMRLMAVFGRESYREQEVPLQIGTGSKRVQVARGAVVGLPIVGLFWALLASADAVFAEIVNPAMLPLGRFGTFATAGVVLVPLLRLAATSVPVMHGGEQRRFGIIEASVVLGMVNGLFLLFVFVRFGATQSQPLSDEEFRASVRTGFFQLLAVALLTIVLVSWLRRITQVEQGQRRRFIGLSLVAVVLAATIDMFALINIADYVRLNFNSPLRYWSFGFGVMLLAVFLALVVRLLNLQADRRWFLAAMFGIWLVFVQVIAVSNPDRRIAEFNFANPQVSPDGETVIAANPLIWLSDDATEVIIANLDVLRPMSLSRHSRVVTHLCSEEPTSTWREWNRARRSGETMRGDLCRTAASN